MSECKILNALVSTCQECVEDCEDAKYEILKLLVEAKEVGDFHIGRPQHHLVDGPSWQQVTFWVRR